MISSSLMSGQSAQPSSNIPARDAGPTAQSAEVIKNYRDQLYHATPAGDRFANRELRHHLRQLNRAERHLRRELRRLRRERAGHPIGR
jgi:hypothetical protein